jgi:hypothetical protein
METMTEKELLQMIKDKTFVFGTVGIETTAFYKSIKEKEEKEAR